MKHKIFDPSLSNKYDVGAKDATIAYFTSIGVDIQANPTPMKQDLVAVKNGNTFYVECEVKGGWNDRPFPFLDIRILERKRKYFGSKTLFVVWNTTFNRFVMFWADHIKHLPVTIVAHSWAPEGEGFTIIPLELTKEVLVHDNYTRRREHGDDNGREETL